MLRDLAGLHRNLAVIAATFCHNDSAAPGQAAPASFGGLMAKGGFRLWANYSGVGAGGVGSPVTLESIAGAVAVVANRALGCLAPLGDHYTNSP